jgi:hypothetical protein
MSLFFKPSQPEASLVRTSLLWTTRAAFGMALSASAMAQTTLPGATRIDNREIRQEQRIDQGIASGQLNRRETARLDAGQNRIDRMENRALSDGSLSGRERLSIEHAQDRQSRQINRQKHDAQRR